LQAGTPGGVAFPAGGRSFIVDRYREVLGQLVQVIDSRHIASLSSFQDDRYVVAPDPQVSAERSP
jgi:hypothetical protein